MSDRQCKRCGDTVHYLSTDNLCDGCVEEEAVTDSSHQELLAQAAEAAKQGWLRQGGLEFTPTPPKQLEALQSIAKLSEALNQGLTDAAILRWDQVYIDVSVARALIQILQDHFEALQDRESAKAALQEYAEHLPDCKIEEALQGGGGDAPCTCGLTVELTRFALVRSRG